MSGSLRVGVIGAGHFGRFHAQKLAAAARVTLAGIHDPDAARARTVAAETRTHALSLPDLLAATDAVVIAAPAERHHALTMQALAAGRHVLVEKPIAATLEEADALAGLATERRLVVQVGHLVRYSAEYEAVASRMGRPLYIEATRIAPYKPRGTDVSVILDLMIHDLDLILALVDSPIASVDAVGAPVASRHEDIANARLRFANGCVATITASRISLKTERKMRLFAAGGYMSVNFRRPQTHPHRPRPRPAHSRRPRRPHRGIFLARPRRPGRRTNRLRRLRARRRARAGRRRRRPPRPGRRSGGHHQHGRQPRRRRSLRPDRGRPAEPYWYSTVNE